MIVGLEMRTCANGETKECFLTLDGKPVYGPRDVGVFLDNPTPEQALCAALRNTIKEN